MEAELSLAIEAAEAACVEILDVYNSGDFGTEQKADRTPLTRADKRSHAKILEVLKRGSKLPILSEEGRTMTYDRRIKWTRFWVVDPLDGTKEFVARNGQFTVNIALVDGGVPVMGVIAVPVTGDVYYASQGDGAFVKKEGKTHVLPRRAAADMEIEGLRVVASRSHMSPDTEEFIQTLRNPKLVTAGSSLKFMMLAAGDADIYPRFAPTMEWDTAAGQAIVTEVGGKVLDRNTHEVLRYNKEELVNPHFLVVF